MKTFLLHGGGTSKESEANDEFFHQFTALVDKPNVSILLCYWSRPKEHWDQLAQRDSAKILKKTNQSVEFHIVEDAADLFAQLANFDVLYVAGGHNERIEPYYQQLSKLGDALDGKIYAGSSMGAFLVSKQYVLSLDSQDTSTSRPGVGLLPIQVLCHWNVEPEKMRKLELLRASSELPIVTINESEFVTFYQ